MIGGAPAIMVGSLGKPTTTTVPFGRSRLAAVEYASFVAAVTSTPGSFSQPMMPFVEILAYRVRHTV